MILWANNRLLVHPKRKKRHGIVMFIYMNAVNYYALQPPKKKCTTQETNISKMKEIVYTYKPDIEEIHAINLDMREHINSCHKESESRTAYPEYNTAHFNNVANISVNSDSITP